MKPKSLQTSVSKRDARAESQPSGPLVFPSVVAKASQDLSFALSNAGTVLSQFEAPIQRKGNCGARDAERFTERGEKGGEEGVAKHSARVVPELVPEIVPE